MVAFGFGFGFVGVVVVVVVVEFGFVFAVAFAFVFALAFVWVVAVVVGLMRLLPLLLCCSFTFIDESLLWERAEFCYGKPVLTIGQIHARGRND